MPVVVETIDHDSRNLALALAGFLVVRHSWCVSETGFSSVFTRERIVMDCHHVLAVGGRRLGLEGHTVKLCSLTTVSCLLSAVYSQLSTVSYLMLII